MRTILSGCLVAAALTTAAPPATAAGGNEFTGGCGVNSIGYLYGVGVAYSSVPQTNPVSVDLTCDIRIDGVSRQSVTYSGTVVLAGATELTVNLFQGTDRQLCETVDFRHTSGVPETKCYPIRAVGTDLAWVYAIANEYFEDFVDPRLCPVLAQRRPSAGDVVVTDAEGDVYVLGDAYWDCPPYSG